MDKIKNHLDYLNLYTDEIKKLNKELSELINMYKYCDINKDLLQESIYLIDEIYDIFSYHSYTKIVAPIFENLSIELSNIDVESLTEVHLSAFELLEKIFEEINEYISMYFIQRTLIDVKIFKDSLQSNINYFLTYLKEEEDTESEIEFF